MTARGATELSTLLLSRKAGRLPLPLLSAFSGITETSLKGYDKFMTPLTARNIFLA